MVSYSSNQTQPRLTPCIQSINHNHRGLLLLSVFDPRRKILSTKDPLEPVVLVERRDHAELLRLDLPAVVFSVGDHEKTH